MTINATGIWKRMLLTTSCVLLAGTLHATIVLQETFDGLANGELNGQNGWTATTSEGTLVGSGGLGYTNGFLRINGGTKSLAIGTGNTDTTLDFYKGIGAQSGNNNEIFWSFTLRVDSVDAGDRFFFGVDASSDWSSGAAGAGDVTTGAAEWGARLNNANYDHNITYNTGQTYFLVVGISTNGTSGSAWYDYMRVWVNPTSPWEGAATFTQDATTFTTTMNDFGFARNNSVSLAGYIDNITVGQSFFDVTSPHLIPEPSSVVLMGLGSLITGLAWRRRRQPR